MSLPDRIARALRDNIAVTSGDATDPRLRSRVYGVPFEDVWRAALALAQGGLRGWLVTSVDDREGVIVAEATTPVFHFVDDVTIRIQLDANAQTRVDMRSASRKSRADLGVNTRRVARFFRALDARLSGQPPRSPLFPTGGDAGRAGTA